MSLDLKDLSFLPDSSSEDDFAETVVAADLGRVDAQGLRQRIALASENFYKLFLSEISQSQILLGLDVPDPSGAFFHAYRAFDAYIESVIVIPALRALVEPIGAYLERSNYSPREALNARFIPPLREAALRLAFGIEIGDSLTQSVRSYEGKYRSLRNSVFHGFDHPPIEDVHLLTTHAKTIVEEIERACTHGL